MAFDRAPLATGEQTEPLVEPSGELRRAHRRDPGRRELDRQRDPIEAPHTSATAAALASVTVKSAFTATARSTNKRTASLLEPRPDHRDRGSASDGTARMRSPAMPKPFAARRQHHQARAPASNAAPGRRPGRADARSCRAPTAAPSVRKELDQRLLELHTRAWRHPEHRRDRVDDDVGSRTGASSTNHAPSRNPGNTSPATCNASRVLPTPPTPVSVTTRDLSNASRDPRQLDVAAHERARLQRQVPRERIQGAQRPELPVQVGMHHLKQPLGPAQVAQPVLPRSTNPQCSGIASWSSSSVANDTTIWPPCATDINRAARFTAVPK